MENNKKNSFVMGSFYKLLNKDIKELNGIVISLFSVLFLVGVGFISYKVSNSYALFEDSLTGSKIIEVEASLPSAVDTIIAKVGIDGLVEETHPATEQLEAVTDYRYTGANPNNYVSFNNELWRIIGVFPTDDGTGNIENRVKIIRNESIGDIAWDDDDINDWSTASLQQLLNSGDYYNRTGSYTSIGLTEESKNMISDSKWYLGGVGDIDNTNYDLTSRKYYEGERGTEVYSGHSISFIGKVGLMYPSDYGYATGGGSTTSREECLAAVLYDWELYSDCFNNDWLYDSNLNQWAIVSYSYDSDKVFLINASSTALNTFAHLSIAVRPALYLSSDVMITGGTGTSSDPYILSK